MYRMSRSEASGSMRVARREKKKRDFREFYSFEAMLEVSKRLKLLEETVALKDEEIQELKREVKQ